MKVVCLISVGPTWRAKNEKTTESGKIYTARVISPTGDLKYFGSYYLCELDDYYPDGCFELVDEYRNKKLESIGI